MNEQECAGIVDTIVNGNFSHAVERIKHGCRTKPEKMAYRLCCITVELIARRQFRTAKRLGEMFNES